MRGTFAHEAVVRLEDGGDPRALGAAITVALCGHWEHEPPCPLAPHHTEATEGERFVQLRVLFATEPENEAEVRRRIEAALAGGRLAGPDDRTTRWTLRESGPTDVRAGEAEHSARLTAQ